MAHTPGIWVAGKMDEDGSWAVATHEGTALAQMVAAPGPHNEANARVMAASSDLLAIAKRIEAAMDFDASDHPMFDGMQKQLLDAIAKAEGE